MNKINKMKHIKEIISTIQLPSLTFMRNLDKDVYILLGMLFIDEDSMPEELRDIMNNIISAEEIEILLNVLPNRRSAFDKFLINRVVDDIIIKEDFPAEFFTINDLKENPNNLKVMEIINSYYIYKYIQPILQSRDFKGIFKDIKKFINKDYNDVSYLVLLSYLLDIVMSMVDEETLTELIYEEIVTSIINIIAVLNNKMSAKILKLISIIVEEKNKKEELDEKLITSKTNLEVIKKENKKLLEELKLKKDKSLDDMTKDIKANINNLSKSFKEHSNDVLRKSYENIISKNITEISELKSQLKLANYKLKEVENKYDLLNNSINEDFIFNFITSNDLSENITNKLKVYLNDTNLQNNNEDTNKEVSNKDINEKENSDIFINALNIESKIIKKEEVEVKDDYLVGYVSIDKDKHFTNLPSGEVIEIINLPRKVFLAEGQFVVIYNNGNYMYSTKQALNGFRLNSNSKLSIVKMDNEKLFAYIDNKYVEIKNTMNLNIYDKIVAIVENNEIKRLFKGTIFNADNYLKSIKAKGFTAYYVVNRVDSHYIIRNIETGKEIKQNLNTTIVNKDDILILDKDNNIITNFQNPNFYTNSEFYKNYKYGTLLIKDGSYYFKSIESEELKVLNNVPKNCRDGAVIRTDERDRFIKEVSDEEYHFEVPVRRAMRKLRTNKYDINLNDSNTDIIGTALILGNLGLQKAYKSATLKKGYKSIVLDGYENYNKVFKEAKKVDKIVIVEDFIDHNIMWELKKKYDNIIYVRGQGANIIAEQLANNVVGRKQLENI